MIRANKKPPPCTVHSLPPARRPLLTHMHPGPTRLPLLVICHPLLLCLLPRRGPIPEPIRGGPRGLGSCCVRTPGVWLCCRGHAEPHIHSSAHDRTQQHRRRHRLPQVCQCASAANRQTQRPPMTACMLCSRAIWAQHTQAMTRCSTARTVATHTLQGIPGPPQLPQPTRLKPSSCPQPILRLTKPSSCPAACRPNRQPTAGCATILQPPAGNAWPHASAANQDLAPQVCQGACWCWCASAKRRLVVCLCTTAASATRLWCHRVVC